MLHALNAQIGNAAVERLTLLLNHLLSAEPAAVQRLAPHAGQTVDLRLDGWPALLPALPSTAFRVTPAGLLEWCGPEPLPGADLRVVVQATNPALALVQALAGTRPQVDVAGDAAFAADLSWLFDNLRWDLQDDLARIVGPAPAREIARLAGGIRRALADAAGRLRGLVDRARGEPAGPPPK
jgi:ubiquinone biosynthesis protein UbiJ